PRREPGSSSRPCRRERRSIPAPRPPGETAPLRQTSARSRRTPAERPAAPRSVCPSRRLRLAQDARLEPRAPIASEPCRTVPRTMARVNLVERWTSKFLAKPLSVRAAAGVIVTGTLAVVVVTGVLMRVIDQGEFPSVCLGMWWSLQTVTTVGYGDVVPTTVGGRIVGAVTMLQGIAFLAIVTAAITSSFVTRASRERVFGQPHAELTDRELIEERLDELERKIHMLLSEQR